jgi:hypothetical protein
MPGIWHAATVHRLRCGWANSRTIGLRRTWTAQVAKYAGASENAAIADGSRASGCALILGYNSCDPWLVADCTGCAGLVIVAKVCGEFEWTSWSGDC